MSWPLIPVCDLCELAVDCVNKTAPTVEYETEFKMIRTTNVKGGFIDLNEVRYVTEDVFKKWTRRSKPRYGDVVLTREAPVGEVGRFTSDDEKVFLGQRLFHYRPNPQKLDWNFLAYALQSPQVQGKFKGMGFGATVDHVRVGDAEKLPIPYPPLSIQQRIGSVLSAYDDLIENNRRRIQLLEQAARLLYKEWFVHLRFPGHEHTRIVDGVPVGWNKYLLGDIATIRKGKNITQDTVDVGDIPVVAGGVRPAYYNNVANALGPVITISASGANAGYVALYLRDVWASDCSFISRADNPEIWFLFLLMKSRQKEITGMQVGAAQPHVYPKHVASLSLIYPPTPLRNLFNENVDGYFCLISYLEKQIENLTKARDLLLPKLMNGEVEV